MDLVDQIVDVVNSANPQRVNFQTKVFAISENEWEEVTQVKFDLLTSLFADKVYHPAPEGKIPLTTAQASAAAEPYILKSEADILKQLLKRPDGAMQLNTSILIAGVLAEDKRQGLVRDLVKVGSETASAPAFTIKSGEQQRIDMPKQFAYPAGYLPHEKSPDAQPGPPAIGEMVNIIPVVGPDGQTIDVDFGVVSATSLLGFLTEKNGKKQRFCQRPQKQQRA